MRSRTQGAGSLNSTKQSLHYRKTIETLKEETKKLKAEISSEKVQSSNLGNESYFGRLQDQGDNFSRKIKQEKEKLDDLDSQIAEIQKLMEDKRKALNTNKEKKESNQIVLTKIKKTEHKLDKTLQKYNEAVAGNKQLREQIDELRREKTVYENIYDSLANEYKAKEVEKDELKEEKKKALKKRDDAKTKLLELKTDKKKAEKELESFGRDWQVLEKIIEKERNINDFLEITEIKPALKPEENNEIAAEMPMLKDKALINQTVKMVEQYEKAFRNIEETTGIADIGSLVNTFIEAEKHNYSLFTYVNELANEVEMLEKQISQLKQDIKLCKDQDTQTEDQRKQIMSDLELNLSQTEARAEAYQQKYEKTMITINALKLGVEQILDKIGCNNPNSEEMIKNQGVDEANLMQCLSIIELRTNEILQMYEWCTTSVTENSPQLPVQVFRSKVPVKYDTEGLPVIGDSNIDDEEANEPFSKTKFMEWLSKKDENSNGK